MENTVPMKNDFLQPLIETIQRNAERQDRRMDELEGKIDKNTGLTQKALDEIQTTNGKVKEHDGAIKRLERRKGKRLEVNPNVIYLIALGAVILLLIVASLLHVNLGGLTK